MQNRQEWLQERKTYIGASDVASILGVSKWKTPLSLYLEKTSIEVNEDEPSGAAYWGNVLENVIAQEYSKRLCKPVSKEENLIRHKTYPFLAANIDRWVGNKEYVLECKTSNFMMKREWGEEFSDEIPESYLCQVAFYAAICEVPKVDIAVLIGGQDFRTYTYEKDIKFENDLIQAGVNFWQKYIEPRVQPPCSNLEDTALLYPESIDNTIYATAEIEKSIFELKQIAEQMKTLAKKQENLKCQVQSFMQENDALINSDGKKLSTWKSIATRRTVDSKKLKSEYPKVFKECSKLSKPSRMFLLK